MAREGEQGTQLYSGKLLAVAVEGYRGTESHGLQLGSQ